MNPRPLHTPDIDLDSCVIYQIYPMSFQDSDGDGMGDINGIRQRLGYLATLGVDMLWLTPLYRSPKRDNGYDVADYRAIDPAFGTLAEMEQLIADAAAHGIGIMMDIVANHTSTEHEWFVQALAGDPRYQGYYVFRDQAFVDAHPITSIFGGSGWQYVPALDRYYLHNFDASQADLDWDNPAVRAEMAEVINFWLGKGIRGFRFDVIDMVSKEWDRLAMSNGPRLHDYIRELNAESFGGQGIITVGETWGADLAHMQCYSAPDGSEFSMVFNFEHLGLGSDKWTSRFDPLAFKRAMARHQQGLHGRGWNSLFLGNHDLPRAVSRFGDDRPEWREISAKLWAMVLQLMQGTPFIYQGEELAMTNRHWQPDELRDVEAINYRASQAELDPAELSRRLDAIGRDNARTPMQWDAGPHAGFSTATPWIALNANHVEINAAEQLARPDSPFHCYRQLIALRKAYPVIRHGDFELLDGDDPDRISYRRCWQDPASAERHTLLLLANLTARPLVMPHLDQVEAGATLLMSNYPGQPTATFAPYQAAAWLLPARE
ncbi:alpha-glucosidase [Aeromonas hydrophila]|uniref:alpha-glucosidase n=1 Tax=Aeromonas hydrophila TaxID=644 RepID=UPI0005D9332A|nr:alpha-glucosidase [Aeromonas hydrophila]AKA16412.1 trehalose-6-phosphate hydrolase [Aeromonas hydrophila]HAT2248205.1 alpha-glucosidase [Aeromonas hydrophila]HAT2383472.1 alpha-glucosidase [Aeromonas hydrophila]HAT2415663.1 alpha-glucosidase [Aeromonas hydrophila]HAT2526351.1 alpha-glucosidase [Aeromonas hydrophila]